MPRRSRPLSATGPTIALAAAAVISAVITCTAQTLLPNAGVDLLQPSLEGNPTTPPRFRRPGSRSDRNQAPPTDAFAPSRVGATPVYGSPPGFGAGDTGFNSNNTGRNNTPTSQNPPPLPGAPDSDTTFDQVPDQNPPLPPPRPAAPPAQPPVIYPARAAARPGASLPPLPETLPVSNPPAEVHPLSAANRPGGVVPIPPADVFEASASTPPPGLLPPNSLPVGTLPVHTLPTAATDPYEALGIKAGSFVILPAVEFSAGYDADPQRVPGGAGSLYFVVAPELHVRSDWSRHSFTADIVGSYTTYDTDFTPSLNHPFLNSKIDGTIDVTRDTHIILENRVIIATDNPGSPNLVAGLAKLPINTTVGGTLGIIEEFNRLTVTLKGTADRSTYNNSVLTDGEQTTNDDRNYNQFAGILRTAYEFDPDFKPFVEISEDQRNHDLEFDRYGLQRDSTGTSATVGADLNLFGSLTGEFGVGYIERVYKDPTLPDIGGVIANGSLLWQATGLTSAKLTAASAVNESILPGVSGAFSRDLDLQVDHALRRWLIVTLQAGIGRDEYVGSTRDDMRYFTSLGITYKLNRCVSLNGLVREDWLTSTVAGVAYSGTSFLAGIRLQR